MTHKQEIAVKKFCLENDAKVTAFITLGKYLVVTYSVPQAPAQESLTAYELPEWAEITYGPLGTQLEFKSSWDNRRRVRTTAQAAYTGSLERTRGPVAGPPL